MNLIKDYIHTIDALWGVPGQCRIRMYRGGSSLTVFICSELPGNESGSITTVIEWLATEVWEQEGRPEPFTWIEHYPAEISPTHAETFHEVTFARPPGTRFFHCGSDESGTIAWEARSWFACHESPHDGSRLPKGWLDREIHNVSTLRTERLKSASVFTCCAGAACGAYHWLVQP